MFACVSASLLASGLGNDTLKYAEGPEVCIDRSQLHIAHQEGTVCVDTFLLKGSEQAGGYRFEHMA